MSAGRKTDLDTLAVCLLLGCCLFWGQLVCRGLNAGPERRLDTADMPKRQRLSGGPVSGFQRADDARVVVARAACLVRTLAERGDKGRSGGQVAQDAGQHAVAQAFAIATNGPTAAKVTPIIITGNLMPK